MRIELTWQRSDAADHVVTVPVAAGLLKHVLHHAEPVVESAASALGVGVLARAALPFAVKLARHALAAQE